MFIDNLVYLELSGYRTLDFKTLPKLGVDPFGMPGPFAGLGALLAGRGGTALGQKLV